MAVRPSDFSKKKQVGWEAFKGGMSFFSTNCIVSLEKVGKASEMKDYFEDLPSLQCWTTDILPTLFPISTT